MTRSRLQEILELVRSRDVDDAAYSDYFSEVVAHDAALRGELEQVTGERDAAMAVPTANLQRIITEQYELCKQQLAQAQAENARLREALDVIRKKSYEPDPERPALSTRAEIQLLAEAALNTRKAT